MSELTGDAGTYEAITPGDVVTSISLLIVEPAKDTQKFGGLKAKSALFTVEDETITFTIDGTTPTAAAGTNAGHKLNTGDSLIIHNANSIKNFKCIDTVSGSAGTIKVTCFF